MKRAVVASSVLGIGMMGYATPAGDMPPNTIKLSDMMQQLSAQPGFTEAFLAQIQGAGKHKAGAALLTPELVHHLRELIAGKDWQRLDHFPGWTMAEINPTVRIVGHVAGKDGKVDSMATAGGAPSGNPASAGDKPPSANQYLDLGDYLLDKSDTVDLTEPSKLPGFSTAALVSSLGAGVTRGDSPSPLAPEHPESQRLADMLNRLSMNTASQEANPPPTFHASFRGNRAASPQDLITALLSTGHNITVTDTRYFANFGHLHFNGKDVMMPFWINSQIIVPDSDPARPLLVPVSHAEYEWHIRGPLLNADVSFYFGIDGKAEFRTMDQLDQAWVMKRDAHTYTGADAIEVTRLAGLIVQTYAHLHQAHPSIPFGGYYAFGVCQDVVAAIEMKMTGKTTLFPNTADEVFFNDPRDAEINDLIKRLPKDRDGRPPEVERIFGSLPVGTSTVELNSVSIPGLGAELVAAHDAWTSGSLERIGDRRRKRNWLYGLGFVLMLGIIWQLRRRTRKSKEKLWAKQSIKPS